MDEICKGFHGPYKSKVPPARIEDIRQELPAPGTPLRKKLYDGRDIDVIPQKCRVIGVNEGHLFYRVEFACGGLRECYKVPEVRG